MTTGFLKSNGHAIASHNSGPRATVHLPTVLTDPESKLYQEFGQWVLAPLAGPPGRSKKSDSVNLWGCVFSTSLPNFIFIGLRMKTNNRFEGFYRVSLENEYLGPFHGPKTEAS